MNYAKNIFLPSDVRWPMGSLIQGVAREVNLGVRSFRVIQRSICVQNGPF